MKQTTEVRDSLSNWIFSEPDELGMIWCYRNGGRYSRSSGNDLGRGSAEASYRYPGPIEVAILHIRFLEASEEIDNLTSRAAYYQHEYEKAKLVLDQIGTIMQPLMPKPDWSDCDD